MTKQSRPKWDLGRTLRDGAEMQRLAVENRARLEPRLPAGLIDGLGADLATLRGETSATGVTRVAKKAATRSVEQSIANAMELVLACREAIKRSFQNDKKVQGDFGVGLTMKPAVVTSIATALTAIEHGFGARPAEARQAGLLPEDLAEVQEALKELLGEDDVQETKKDTSKEATSKRNATQVRVEQAMETIVGVVAVVFRREAKVVEKFRGLLPTKVVKKKVVVG